MSPASNEILRQTVETFWECFPPFWHRVRGHIRDVAAERFDITVEQFHILRHIRKGRASVSELAEAKNISRPAISQAVDVLVHKGLIVRSTGLRDRRHIQLTLTVEGDTLLDAVSEEARKWMMGVLSVLDDDELRSLTHSMQSLKKTQPV
jgi:DNA-binding MarR family transcriptional regulator